MKEILAEANECCTSAVDGVAAGLAADPKVQDAIGEAKQAAVSAAMAAAARAQNCSAASLRRLAAKASSALTGTDTPDLESLLEIRDGQGWFGDAAKRAKDAANAAAKYAKDAADAAAAKAKAAAELAAQKVRGRGREGREPPESSCFFA